MVHRFITIWNKTNLIKRISNDLAMQVVSVGFVIGVIQDSCETTLNSSTDVLFTAVAEMSSWPKEKRY